MTEYRDKHLLWAREFLARHDRGYRFRWEVYFGELERLLRDADSFLDAGCGDNLTVRKLFFDGFKVGVDVAVPRHRAHFCGARLEQLPFPPTSFEVIGCRFVLEHVKDPLAVFREFGRVLKPGGFLLTQTTNRAHPMIFLARLLPQVFRRALLHRIYGQAGGAEFKTYHKFNRPCHFRRPQAGLVPVQTWHIENLHLESKTLFHMSYFYHVLSRRLRRPSWRSTITTLWQKPVESTGRRAVY